MMYHVSRRNYIIIFVDNIVNVVEVLFLLILLTKATSLIRYDILYYF